MKAINRSGRQRFKHEAISSKVDEIEAIYSESKIIINQSHQLRKLLNSARQLSNEWSKENFEKTDMNMLFDTLHVERIASAIEVLKVEKDKYKYLKSLLRGTLNFFEREISHAKSILWELEACTKIKKAIPETFLKEPDIVVNIGEYQIAIPCKKKFSEKGVPKVLSNAVAQIESENEFGIVAINIDDLIPAQALLKARTFSELGDKLHAHNMDFFKSQERQFIKYLSASRIVAVIASTSVVADILNESPRFNNFNEWAIWTIPELKPKHKNVIDIFRDKIIG